LARLVGRDLGEVEHVADVERVTAHLDAGEAVDGEVAERVRRGRDGCSERRDEAEQEPEALHRTYLLARGAKRIEKCGLSASARRSHARDAALRPRQRSIMPRW